MLWALPVSARQPLFYGTPDTTGSLPVGWQARFWTTTDQAPSPGSGRFSFVLHGRQADRLCTPVLDARTAVLDTLSYRARRTRSYPVLHLTVRASVDGGRTFPYVIAATGAALPASASRWQIMRFPLPPQLSGTPALQLCFDALGGMTSSARLQLDDIRLYGSGQLHQRLFALHPTQLNAGFVAVGDTAMLPLYLRNQSDRTLTITLPAPPPPWTLTRHTMTLAPHQIDTLKLYVAPSQPDTFTATWMLPFESDTLWIPLRVTATPPVHYLGWSTPHIFARARDTVRLGLQLQLGGNVPTLQGLLLTARLPHHAHTYLVLEPGASLPAPDRWTLRLTHQDNALQILLLGDAGQALSPGSYPELLRLQLGLADVSDTTRLQLTLQSVEAIAATPEAPSVGLALHPRRLHLTVRPRIAQAVLTPDTLRLPATPVGTRRSATIYLSNPGGERPLHARLYLSSDPTLTIVPDSIAVAPNDTVHLTVRFEPTLRNFGRRVASLHVHHDGLGGDTLLIIEATGTGGLGDATEEGAVDVADLQRGIRYVLALEEPEAQDRLVLDVAPFPYGDGRLRLNDLGVLVQAIARNQWPDGHLLPTPPPASVKTAKQDTLITLHLMPESNAQTRLEIETPRPFGALQLMLPPVSFEAARQALPANAHLRVANNPNHLTLLLYRLDGAAFAPGRYRLGMLRDVKADTLHLLRWVAVDAIGRYLSTTVQVVRATPVEPAASAPLFFPPYPQPFAPTRHTALILSGTLPAPSAFTLEIFDLLGRRLTYTQGHLPAGAFQYHWNGRDRQGRRLPPGLYLLRLRTASLTQTFPVVIIH